MSFFRNLHAGAAYINMWPDEPGLKLVFGEARIKPLFRMAVRMFPPLTAFLIFWIWYNCGGFKGLYLLMRYPSSGSLSLYISITGLILMWCMGVGILLAICQWGYSRSCMSLNEAQREVYLDLCSRLGRQPESAPDMAVFAATLADAFRVLKDKSFTDRLF